jgi:hypothetical protein
MEHRRMRRRDPSAPLPLGGSTLRLSQHLTNFQEGPGERASQRAPASEERSQPGSEATIGPGMALRAPPRELIGWMGCRARLGARSVRLRYARG